MNPYKKRMLFGFFAGMCLLFLAGVFTLYFQLRDVDLIRQLVVEELSSRTQREVQLGSAELDFSEGVGIRLNEVRLKGKVPGQGELSAEKVWVTVRPFPLLRQKIEIRRITLEGLSLQITRDASGHSILGEESESGNPSSAEVIPFSQLLLAGLSQDLILRKGNLRFVDFTVEGENGPAVLEMSNITLKISKPLLKMVLSVDFQGEIQQEEDALASFSALGKVHIPDQEILPANVDWTANLKIGRLNSRILRPHLAAVLARLPEDQSISMDLDIGGNLAGTFRSTGTLLHSSLPEKGPPMLTQAGLSTRGEISYEMQCEGETLTISQVTYQSGKFSLRAKGAWSRLYSDNPGVTFSMNTSEFPVENSSQYLPFYMLPQKAHESLHHGFEKGGVEIKALEFDGSLDQLHHIDQIENLNRLRSDLRLHRVDFGRELAHFQNVSGKATFEKAQMQFEVTKGQIREMRIGTLSGKVDFSEGFPQADMLIELEGTLPQWKQSLKIVRPDIFSKALVGEFSKSKGSVQMKVTLKGPLDRLNEVEFDGDLRLDQVGFEDSRLPEPIQDVVGSVHFISLPGPETVSPEKEMDRSWNLELQGFSGRLGNHLFSEVKGDFILGKKGVSKNLKGNVVLARFNAGQWVAQPSSGNNWLFLNNIQFQGGQAAFTYQEKPQTRKTGLARQGTLKFKNVSMKHASGFRPIQDLSGSLKFDDQKITLETQRGFYGDSPIHLKGELKNYLSDQSQWKMAMDSADFMSLDFEKIPFLRTLDYRGPAWVRVNMRFAGQRLNVESQVDLSRASYNFKKLIVKPAGVQNKIDAVAILDLDKGVDFKKLVFELAGTHVRGKGQIREMDNPRFSVQLGGRNFDPRRVANYIQLLKGSQSGKVDFELAGQGAFKNPESYKYQGKVILKEVVYKTRKFPGSIRVSTRMGFVNNKVRIHEGHLVSGRTDLSFKGNYLFGDHPTFRLDLGGKALVLGDWISPGKDKQPPLLELLGAVALIRKGTGQIKVNLGKFQHKFWSLRNVSADFSLKDRIFKTENMEIGEKGKNHVMIQGEIDLAQPTLPRMEALVMSRDTSVSEFMNNFGPIYKDSLWGKLHWIKAKVSTTGRNWQEFRSNLQGTLALDLRKGKIHTGNLLNGAIDMFGITTSQKDREERKLRKIADYEKIFGAFNIVDSIAHTENFLYETPGEKMSLVGDFDLSHNTMDNVVGVSSMRNLDKILTKIPVVGDIITAGDEESLFTNYYSLEGPFEDPQVTPVPLTSLEKKVVGIFQGIFEAPQKIFPKQEPQTP